MSPRDRPGSHEHGSQRATSAGAIRAKARVHRFRVRGLAAPRNDMEAQRSQYSLYGRNLPLSVGLTRSPLGSGWSSIPMSEMIALMIAASRVVGFIAFQQ